MGCDSDCSKGAGEGVCLQLCERASRMEEDGIPLIGSSEKTGIEATSELV